MHEIVTVTKGAVKSRSNVVMICRDSFKYIHLMHMFEDVVEGH